MISRIEQEVNQIRLKIYEETKDLKPEQHAILRYAKNNAALQYRLDGRRCRLRLLMRA